MAKFRKTFISIIALLMAIIVTSCAGGEIENSSSGGNSEQNSTQTSTEGSVENSTETSSGGAVSGEGQTPSTLSNYVNFGKDVVGYVNQDKVSGLYKIGIYTVTSNAKFTSTAGEKSLDGETFPMACQLGASVSPFSTRSITFNALTSGRITIYALVGSSGVTLGKIQLFNSSSQVVSTIDITDQFAKHEIEITAPGEYALMPTATASINVYAIAFSGEGKTEDTGSGDSGSSGDSGDGSLSATEKEIVTKANNAITWQIPEVGGWDKDYDLHVASERGSNAYNKSSGWTAKGGGYLGTIDNGGTYSHMETIAQAYSITGEQKYKDSFAQAIGFLKNLQTEKGGFTQVYPKRGNYSDYVTFNDDAMVSVMKLLRNVYEKKAPYTNIVDDTARAEVKAMFDKGIEYILASQIEVQGVKAGWCAQHDPVTYEPKEAREYERPSISGSESIGIIELLMSLTDNQKAQDAGLAAVKWFDAHKLVDKAFSKNGVKNATTGVVEYIYDKPGSTIWYRFYDLNGVGFFSDRKANAKWAECNGYFYDVAEISEERRTGYSWMGSWPSSVIQKYLK